MPSRPSDAPTGSTDALRQVTQLYDQAYEALARGDLDRVTALLLQSETMLQEAQQATIDPVTHARAIEAHGRLHAAMQRLHGEMGGELAQVRQGQRALRGYSGHRGDIGRRVESRC